jgi:hypothetical protein
MNPPGNVLLRYHTSENTSTQQARVKRQDHRFLGMGSMATSRLCRSTSNNSFARRPCERLLLSVLD